MSISPELSDQLRSGSSDSATQARRLILPYDDLQILAPPERNLNVSADLLSALSVLVAQGPDKPRLLTSDVEGFLRVAGRLNVVTQLVAGFSGVATTLLVKDSTGIFPGDHISLVSSSVPGQTCVDVVVNSIPDGQTIKVNGTCAGQTWSVGDSVVGEQVVNIRQIFEAVRVAAGGQVQILGASAGTDNSLEIALDNQGLRALIVRDGGLPTSASSGAFFNAGVTPSLSFAPVAGRSYIVHAYNATIGTTVATGLAESALITEVGAGGNTLWADALAIPAVANSSAGARLGNCRIATRQGFGVQIAMNNVLAAGQFATLALAVYLT